MKKSLLIAVLAFSGFATAQKGTILVAGSIGFSSEKTTMANDDESKNNLFYVAPKVGYQFHENWTVGISGGVGFSKDEDTEITGLTDVTTETKTTYIQVGPFLRYSKNISEIFGFFTDLDLGYQSEKTSFDSSMAFFPIPDLKGNGFYGQITPAIFINVKKNFGLNVSFGGLGFNSINYDNNGGDHSEFGINFGQTVNIGISKNF